MSNATLSVRKPPDIGHRFADLRPESHNPTARTVEAVLSVGAEVKRPFGVEVLLITPSAVDLGRLTSCGIPLIDSHNIFSVGAAFGRLQRAWFDRGNLMGLLSFDDSENGRMAEGLVSRGTIKGISIGYKVDRWKITDSDGAVVDPNLMRWNDDDCVFTATNWELLEVSLVSVPADPGAFVRSFGSSVPIGAAAASDILARMQARQKIAERNTSEPEPLRCRRRYPGGRIWRGDA
jgi:hypothetical protein